MARHEIPKPVKQKKAAPPKRPKVAALIAEPESIEEHGASIVLDSCRPADPNKIVLPAIDAALYAPHHPEPHSIVVNLAGKKSLYRRFCDWLEE